MTGAIALVGDIMIGDSAVRVGFGASQLLRGARAATDRDRIRALLPPVSHVMGNLETVLSDNSTGTSAWHTGQMRSAPSVASNLRAAGFTALAIANNHLMQHGPKAAADTIATLREAGMGVIGQASRRSGECIPYMITCDASDVAVLGYSLRPQQFHLESGPAYAAGDPDTILAQVRDHVHGGSRVIVSLHWGEEFVDLPSENEVSLGRRLVDAGASVVWGHHPHVARPIERYSTGLIAYSLGNFISDMDWDPNVGSGGLLTVKFSAAQAPPEGEALTLHRARAFVPEGVAPVDIVSEMDSQHWLSNEEYARAVSRTVSTHRRRTYAFALGHLLRYDPTVLRTLARNTIRNRWRSCAQVLGLGST